MTADTALLVEAMQDPLFYDHPVDKVELIETHISWVFLAGPFAYKIKKPCSLGFLDFSTLEKRQHFCNEELRLNRRFAPDIYLEVIKIGREGQHLVIGTEPVVEYAVKMKRFPQNMLLDQVLGAGNLSVEHLQLFAVEMADLHNRAPVLAGAVPYDPIQMILQPVLQNFDQLRPLLTESELAEKVDTVEQWSRQMFEQLGPIMRMRHQDRFVRECHGDVHLGNMVLQDDVSILFDCIEFSENLRWIDVVNDIAFFLMDLDDRGVSSFGWVFLDHYMRLTGDYSGLALLQFYKVYRAMVRAKVAFLHLAQTEQDSAETAKLHGLAQSYIELATGYLLPKTPKLIITHGLSGSGKSTCIEKIAPLCKTICIHSDIERKRLHGLNMTDKSSSSLGHDLYSTAANQKTYFRLHDLAEQVLRSGYSVIVDATFIKKWPRKIMMQLAEKLNISFLILDFHTDIEELTRRLELRKEESAIVSEATPEVLRHQLTHREPLGKAEKEQAIQIFPETLEEVVIARITDQ